MGRTKASPHRRFVGTRCDYVHPPVDPEAREAAARRLRASHCGQTIPPPTFKHASAKPDGVFKGQVAALLEVPIPTDAQSFDLPSGFEADNFLGAYEKAFGSRYRCGNSFSDVAVLAKDWDPCTEVVASGLQHANPTRIADFLKHHDIAINDHLLTIAIAPRGGPCRRFDLSMQGHSLPAIVLKMVQVGMLRMYYIRERDAVQFVVAMHDPVGVGTGTGKMFSSLMVSFLRWLCNYKFAAGATVEKRECYDREFAYDAVRRQKCDVDVDEYLPFMERVRQSQALNVTLRPYQERAVAWMLSRELGLRCQLDIATRVKWDEAKRLAAGCPLNADSSVRVKRDVELDVINGAIVALKETAAIVEEETGRGGLLCDEMGLGKTVELMQLVLCNQLEASCLDDKSEIWTGNHEGRGCVACEHAVEPHLPQQSCLECERVIHNGCLPHERRRRRAKSQGFICTSCREGIKRLVSAETSASELPQSKATVVIIPTTLLLQWQTEIQKHANEGLVVEVYQGHRSGYVPLRRLLKADIVLATYDALKNDVYTFHALRNPRRGLRHAKLHHPTPLPLLSVRWHRIAWDESQMLGARGGTHAAKLAKYLHGTYRWCVSGTPLAHSLQDALPMFGILQVRGGNDGERTAVEWSSLFKPSRFAEDERRLKALLRQVMWRSVKEDVNADELRLPPQVTEVVHTAFGPVERYHYSSLEQTVRTATLRFAKVDNVRSRTVSSDLLTMLRQACCHPQIGNSGRRLMSHAARQALASSGLHSSRRYDATSQAVKRAETPLDMNEVLHALVAKTQAECADALRSFVASGNGLAAVCWLQHSLLPSTSTDVEGLVTAVTLYRETLSLVEENKDVVQMDSIQRMHILFNWNEALDSVASTKRKIMAHNKSRSGREEAIAQLNSLGRTLRDGNLTQEVNDLKLVYVAEAKAQQVACEASFQDIAGSLGRQPLLSDRENYTENEEQSDRDLDWEDVIGRDGPWDTLGERGTKPLGWWDKAVGALLEKDRKKQDQFLNRVVRKLLDAIPGGGMNVRTLAHRLSSIHSFALVLHPELVQLQRARNKLREALREMPGSVPPTQAQVTESGQCQECREFGTGPACAHCRAEKLFKDVERRLYAFKETDETADFVLDTPSQHHTGPASAPDGQADPKTIVNSALRPKGRVSNVFAQNSGGLRFQSEIETILKSLSSAAREVGDDRLNQEVSEWFDRLSSVKKEHTEARALFEAQRSLLARMDEVNMALMRFSVLAPDEDFASLSADQQRHRLPRESLASLNVQFTNEKATTECDFANKRGNLVFLQSLQRCSDEGMASGASPLTGGPCAVCLGEFDDSVSKVALFACGHVLCCDCTLLIIKGADAKSRVSSVRCPTCRTKCSVEEINFTRSGGAKPSKSMEQDNDEPEASSSADTVIEATEEDLFVDQPLGKRARPVAQDVGRKRRRVAEGKSTFYDASAAVIGLIGAKASAMVGTLRGIWQTQETAKVLIFSEWGEVLSLLSRALLMNEIGHSNGAGAGSAMKFAKMVDEFRISESLNVLLLPLKKAGAGLNITEATHVILVEPSMNVALEAQAVGRVHRIGQEHETYVHRIVMKGTIEEAVLRFGDVYRGKTGLTAEHVVSLRDVMGAIHEGEEAVQECVVMSDVGEAED